MYNFKLLTTLAILSLSTILPAMAFAAPLANNGADWTYVNGNSWGGNYSPQTQINADNVDALEVKWIFPIADNANVPAGIQLLDPGQGSNTPPVVMDGKVIIQTNYQRLIAVDGASGAELWSHDYTVNLTEAEERLPVAYNSFFLGQHIHGIRAWAAGNSILASGLACDFYGVDIDSGEESFHVNDLCVDVPGNLYDYQQGSVAVTNIGTYDKGNTFVTVLPGRMHGTVMEQGDFRHTTIGVDMTSNNIVWRVFSFPPHGVLTKDWALQECDVGWFRDIPCSTVAAQQPENLEWDWARPNEPPSLYGGVTANWGMLVIDEDTGYVYTNTGNQGPYTYIGETPGPRLYGSTIMAIDADNGQRIWWSQPMPRDPYDYDCNWGGFLADHASLGKVYVKACKEGLIHIWDAADGTPLNIIDVVTEQVARGQIGASADIEAINGGIKYHLMNPLSNYDMRQMLEPVGSPYCNDPCHLYPFWYNGIFSTDMSYNPELGTMFHWTQTMQRVLLKNPDPPWEPGTSVGLGESPGTPINTTLVARNLATGQETWTWYYDDTWIRSHIVTTTNIVWTGFNDGHMRFLHAETGELLREINLGANLGQTGTTTGKDADGKQKIFALMITGTSFGQTNGGTLVAIGLDERAQQAAQTVTVTQTTRTTVTTTSATTITSTSVSTTTATSTTTMTTTSATTVTSTLAAQTITQTSTAQAQTTTVTSEVTEEVGLSSTITYAAVAVAVIAIIGAAVLYTRKE